MKLTTILFDLDGTLLPMNQETFVKAYFGELVKYMAVYGYEPELLMKTVYTGTGAMIHNDGSATNEDVFWNYFSSVYGDDSRKDIPQFEEFYKTKFNLVKDICGFNPEAGNTIKYLKEKGYTLVLATNPLFPQIATKNRMGWAGLDTEDFAFYTTYEDSYFCKPNPEYYKEVMSKLNVSPEECLMVGNDVSDDMVAASLGLRVFLLTDTLENKTNTDISEYPQGSFSDLIEYINSL